MLIEAVLFAGAAGLAVNATVIPLALRQLKLTLMNVGARDPILGLPRVTPTPALSARVGSLSIENGLGARKVTPWVTVLEKAFHWETVANEIAAAVLLITARTRR